MEKLISIFFFLVEVLTDKFLETDSIFVYSGSDRIPLCRSLVNLWQFL